MPIPSPIMITRAIRHIQVIQITTAQFLDKSPFAHGLHRGSAYVYYLKHFRIGPDRTLIENHKQEAGYRIVRTTFDDHE